MLIQHYFLFLAISKKLKTILKDKQCADLKPWVQSIINHLYWAAVSTPPGEGDLVVAKWKSVERHIQNIHVNHGDLFPICAHGQLRGRRAQKKWLKPSEWCKTCGNMQELSIWIQVYRQTYLSTTV